MSRSIFTRTASGKTKRRRRGSGPPFIQLFHWMVDMPAWHSLSPRAVVAYLEIGRRYNGTNNGSLHLSARELARTWNWSKTSAAEAIEELVEKGFIEVTRASGFNMKDRKRQATEYRLTVLFCDLTRQPPSKAFTKWTPERPPQRTEENISRSVFRDTTVRPSGRSQKNIEEFASTVRQGGLKRQFSGGERPPQRTLIDIYQGTRAAEEIAHGRVRRTPTTRARTSEGARAEEKAPKGAALGELFMQSASKC